MDKENKTKLTAIDLREIKYSLTKYATIVLFQFDFINLQEPFTWLVWTVGLCCHRANYFFLSHSTIFFLGVKDYSFFTSQIH